MDCRHYTTAINQTTLSGSSQCYNLLPKGLGLRTPTHEELDDIFQIITKHHAEDRYHLILAHRHLDLEPDHVMARFPLRGGRSYWTTPVAIQSIDQSNVFEHVFSVNDARGLGASELHVGSAPPIDEADNLIFHEFVDLVCERGLHGLFELQRVMDRGVDMVEFVFDTGMFLVEQELVEEEVLLEGATQCTGWVATRHGGVIEYKGNRICAPHPQYGHLRLTDGKVCNGEDAIRSLNADGSLKNGAFA